MTDDQDSPKLVAFDRAMKEQRRAEIEAKRAVTATLQQAEKLEAEILEKAQTLAGWRLLRLSAKLKVLADEKGYDD